MDNYSRRRRIIGLGIIAAIVLISFIFGNDYFIGHIAVVAVVTWVVMSERGLARGLVESMKTWGFFVIAVASSVAVALLAVLFLGGNAVWVAFISFLAGIALVVRYVVLHSSKGA